MLVMRVGLMVRQVTYMQALSRPLSTITTYPYLYSEATSARRYSDSIRPILFPTHEQSGSAKTALLQESSSLGIKTHSATAVKWQGGYPGQTEAGAGPRYSRRGSCPLVRRGRPVEPRSCPWNSIVPAKPEEKGKAY